MPLVSTSHTPNLNPSTHVLFHILAFFQSDMEMIFLTTSEKLPEEEDRVHLGIGTPTHVINVSLHLSPSRN